MIALFLVGSAAALVGVAAFAGEGNSNPNDQANHVTGRSLEEAMPVFKRAPRELPADVAKIEKSFASATSGPISRVDYRRAQPVPIEGSTSTAWIAPAGDHVCAFIPDPVDGYGAGCVTVTDIELGRGYSFLHDDVQAYTLIYVLDGDDAPKVESKRGVEELKPSVNAVAAHLPIDSAVRSAHGTFELKSLKASLAEGK